MYFLAKTLLTALLVAAISELSRRFSMLAALLASLPITTVLAFVWIHYEAGDDGRLIDMSRSIFWLVIPSLSFFLLFPWLLKMGWKFWPSLATASLGTAALYGLGFLLWRIYSGGMVLK